MRFLLRLVGTAGLFLLASHLLAGFVVPSFTTAVLAALAFGVMNAVVRPVLLLASLPVTLLTLGLFTLVVNAAVMALTALVVPGFQVRDFWAALLGWLVVALGGLALSVVLKKD